MAIVIHGNDQTGNIILFRGGRLLTMVIVKKTSVSSKWVAVLTYMDAARQSRRSYPLDKWGEDEVLHVLKHSEGSYLPAEVGDEMRQSGHSWHHIVTQQDIDRGYVVRSTYNGLDNPVFLRPRTAYTPGDAMRPSESVLA